MGAADLTQALGSSGRLAYGCTDLTAAWPHGGTGLGVVSGVALEKRYQAEELPPDEDRNMPGDVMYLGESWRLSAVLHEHDNDVLSALGLNTTVGDSGQRYTSARGTYRPGQLLGALKGASVVFTADDVDKEESVILHRAVLALEATAAVQMVAGDAHSMPVVFTALEAANGRVADQGILADMADLIFAPGLVLWLDASDSSTITKDGSDRVSAWADKSNAGIVASVTQGTDANKPTVGSAAVNGLDALLFDDAASQYLESTDPAVTAAAFMVYAVVKPDTITAPDAAVITFGAGDGNRFWLGANANPTPSYARWAAEAASSGTADFGSAASNNTAYIWVGKETSSTSRSVNQNGGTAVADTTDVTPGGITFTRVGDGDTVGSTPWSGYICEIRVFDEIHDAAAEAAELVILNAKWSVY